MRKKEWVTPSPGEIRQARKAAGLTQTQAGELIHSTCRAWQKWEAEQGSNDHCGMPLANWELFLIKAGKIKGRNKPKE